MRNWKIVITMCLTVALGNACGGGGINVINAADDAVEVGIDLSLDTSIADEQSTVDSAETFQMLSGSDLEVYADDDRPNDDDDGNIRDEPRPIGPTALQAQAITQVIVRYQGVGFDIADNCETKAGKDRVDSDQDLSFVYGRDATRPIVRQALAIGTQLCAIRLLSRVPDSDDDGIRLPALSLLGELDSGRAIEILLPEVPDMYFPLSDFFVTEDQTEIELKLPVAQWVRDIGQCVRSLVAENERVRIGPRANREIMECLKDSIRSEGEGGPKKPKK